jgi:nickel-dependent lactate racemase
MRMPDVTEGVFPDNALHRELLEIAAMARHDFMVDVALTRTRGIAAVFAGEPLAAHTAGVQFVRESTLASVPEPADLVITTSGGYPLDLTFYQAVKGITAASHVVKPGGTILLVAACREGIGSPSSRKWSVIRPTGGNCSMIWRTPQSRSTSGRPKSSRWLPARRTSRSACRESIGKTAGTCGDLAMTRRSRPSKRR